MEITGDVDKCFWVLDDEFDKSDENQEEEGNASNRFDLGKLLRIYLVNCSSKWTSQTPTGESAFEKIELSSNDDRGFHADGEDANPLKLYFHGGSTGIQLLQVMELRWVWKNADPTWSCFSSYIGYVTPSGRFLVPEASILALRSLIRVSWTGCHVDLRSPIRQI